VAFGAGSTADILQCRRNRLEIVTHGLARRAFCGTLRPSEGARVSAPLPDSTESLPRFPLDVPDVDATGRRRPLRLELVVDASESSLRTAAPAMHGLFDDEGDDHAADLTDVYVPLVVDAPRDPESMRRFDEFWVTQRDPTEELPAVYRPVFPRSRFATLRTVGAFVLLSIAAMLTIATWVGTHAILAAAFRVDAVDEASSQEETSEAETETVDAPIVGNRAP
jgi:hypothetical protein